MISLKTRRKILFSLLYLGEGAPIGFIWWTLPTLWKDAGMGVPEITAFTSVVIFPWIFKFIWSPLIDVFRNEKWNFKAWILGAQSMMILSLLPLLFMDFSPVIFPFLFIHAIAASTQDAAIDAYAISVTPKEELGSVNGWMQFGMLAGRAGIGGLGIVFANKFGHEALVLLIVVLVALPGLALFYSGIKSPLPGNGSKSKRLNTFRKEVWASVKNKQFLLAVLFALTIGAAFESAGALAGPFLLDMGLSSDATGYFFALPSIIATAIGSLSGGWLSDTVGKLKAIAISAFMVVLPLLFAAIFVYRDYSGHDFFWMGLLSLMYFGAGLLTVTTYTWFMGISKPAIAATQFSIFMGMTNGCESWTTWLSGEIFPPLGYPGVFIIMSMVTLISLVLPALSNLKKYSGEGRNINLK